MALARRTWQRTALPLPDFASSEEGNVLAEDQQWAKLRRVVAVVDEV